MIMTDNSDTEREVDLIQRIAKDVSDNTQLSEKQATALLMREVLDSSNQEIAQVLEVGSPASASSYVTRCRDKFDKVDGEVEKLEQEIQKWENTERLEGFLSGNEFGQELIALESVSEELLNMFEGRSKYLIRYMKDGEEKIRILEGHRPSEIGRDVIDYRRIQSMDDLF